MTKRPRKRIARPKLGKSPLDAPAFPNAPRINWAKLHPWAQFVGGDADGSAYQYESKPIWKQTIGTFDLAQNFDTRVAVVDNRHIRGEIAGRLFSQKGEEEFATQPPLSIKVVEKKPNPLIERPLPDMSPAISAAYEKGLLDKFAGDALSNFATEIHSSQVSAVAKACYDYAEAMMAERKRRGIV